MFYISYAGPFEDVLNSLAIIVILKITFTLFLLNFNIGCY